MANISSQQITVLAQTVSIATVLTAAGANGALSLFDVPELKSQPASRSLPQIRWLFSRGSHFFPQAAEISTTGFVYLAYTALPSTSRSLLQLLQVAANSSKVNGYLAAGVLALAIGPFTRFAMVPTNFALIKMNEEKGGFRSEGSAKKSDGTEPGSRSAWDSVYSKGETSQFTDLSGPQSKTNQESTPEEDRKAKELLAKFGQLNDVRALLLLASGVIGLYTALSA